MTLTELAKLVERPDVHQLLVGEYDGPYSLGVTEIDIDGARSPALRLVLVGDSARAIERVTIDEQDVLVIVEHGYSAVVPLTGS